MAATKINRPNLTGIARRERLFHLLDTGREKPITWVSASPGSGKTTLVADYLDARKLPCLWYQVDGGDSDLATFFYYMGLAAKKAAPRYKKPLPLLTSEYFQAIPSFTRRYFEKLFHRLLPADLAATGKGRPRAAKKRDSKSFTIVLDNYQDVPGPAFQEMMSGGLDLIPEWVKVIILSRQEPPPQFARLRANNKISSLGWAEIKFSLEESKEFLKVKERKDLPGDSVKKLHERTDGWAAGLLLMMESSPSGEMTPVPKKKQREVFEYFASEIFDRTDTVVQEVLLKTVFLNKIDPETAEKLTEIDSAGKILESLSRKNYFTKLYMDGYQYHPLFREFLLARSRETFTRLEISILRQRAALLMEIRGQMDEAVGLYMDAHDWGNAMRLTVSLAPALASQGRSKSLEEWIENIPGELKEASPWLLYWLGICRMAYNPVEAGGHFEKACPMFKEEEDVSGLFLAWAAVMDTFVFAWNDFRPMGAWIDELETIARKHPAFPSSDIEARVASGMFNALLWRQPLHPDLPMWAERLNRIVLGDADFSLRISLGNNLALYYGGFREGRAHRGRLAPGKRKTRHGSSGDAGVVWHKSHVCLACSRSQYLSFLHRSWHGPWRGNGRAPVGFLPFRPGHL
ncbi:MAG: hypothetical protein HZA01_17075 [Nitrospinae bacterium]|nr:hypothetical protein [Nitrospinota bacterium]